MKIYPLFSSSSGNLFCLEDNNTNILIDVGVSYKNIDLALKGINKSFDDINGILITHEHTDHCKGVNMIAKKHNNIPIYTCAKTKKMISLEFKEKNISDNIVEIQYDTKFNINNLTILPFKTSHDATQPCGFNISNEDKQLTFATDLGFVSDNIFNHLYNSDYIVLESNYDKVMLEYGSYPYNLKSRIKGNSGHLSNDDASDVIIDVLEKSITPTTSFLMSHLSSNNNTVQIAKDTIFSSLNNYNFNNYSIEFASKDLSFEGYDV